MLFSTSSTVLAMAAATVLSASAAAAQSSSSMSMSMSGMNTTTSSTNPATPSGSMKVHPIQVGNKNGSKIFDPSTINAAVGDMVQFHFWPANHSVAQSMFANPCMPMDAGTAAGNSSVQGSKKRNKRETAPQGFWSGFMPVSTNDTIMPVFTVMINDTKPIWFYCATQKHCQAGMSGVINPVSTGPNTLDAYQKASKLVSKTGTPNEPALTGGTESTSTSNDTMSSGSNSGSGTSTSSGSASSGGSSSSAAPAASSSATTAGSSAASTVTVSGKSASAMVVLVACAMWLL